MLRLGSQALPQTSGRRQLQQFLPAPLVAELPAISAELAALATVQSDHPAEDGSARLLARLGDGQLFESVLPSPGCIPGLRVFAQVG